MKIRKWLCTLLTVILLCTNIDITVFAAELAESAQEEVMETSTEVQEEDESISEEEAKEESSVDEVPEESVSFEAESEVESSTPEEHSTEEASSRESVIEEVETQTTETQEETTEVETLLEEVETLTEVVETEEAVDVQDSTVGDTERADDFEMYLADQFLLSKIHTNIESIYHIFIENLREDEEYQKLVTAYNVVFFEAGDFQSNINNEYLYCENLLFNLLYDDGATDVTENGNEIKADELFSETKDAFTDILETDFESQEKLLNTELLSESQLAALKETLSEEDYNKKCAEQEKIKKALEDLDLDSDILDAISSTIDAGVTTITTTADVIERASHAQAMMNYSDDIAAILSKTYSYIDDDSLKKAVSDYSSYMTSTQSELVMGYVEDWSMQMGMNAVTLCLETAWDALVEKCSVLGPAFVVRDIGKSFMDSEVPLEEAVDSYHKMDKLYELEAALNEVIASYKSTYSANRTPENARKLNYSIELLYEVYRLGSEYADEHANIRLNNDKMGAVYKFLHKKKLEERDELLARIKKSIENEKLFYTTYDNFVEVVYELYCEENSVESYSIVDVQASSDTMSALETWYTKAEEINESSRKVSNLNVSTSLVLASDLEYYGNLNISSGGTLDLNGHTLTIYGDWNHNGTLKVNGGTLLIGCDAVINGSVDIGGGTLKVNGNVLHSGGCLNINKGTFEVTGDYRNQTKTVDEDGVVSYGETRGYTSMDNDTDQFIIKGNVYIHCEQNYQYRNYYNAGTMTVGGDLVQMGTSYNFPCTGTHKIVLNGTEEQRISFASISSYINELELQNDNVIFTTPVKIVKLVSDGKLTSENGALYGLNLDGYTLEIEGDIEFASNIDIAKGTLKVNGNVLHSGGCLNINKGTFEVTGDYRNQSKSVDEDGGVSYVETRGYITMSNDADIFIINGNVYIYCEQNYSYRNLYSAGTMIVGGDLVQMGTSYNFPCTGTHKLILNGTGEQKISFTSTNSYINELELKNENVTITTPVKITKLVSDGKIKSKGGSLYNINLNGHTLEVDGDVELAGGCDLAGGTLKVNGNVKHTSGGITVKGSLIVNGDYTLANTKINEEDEEVLTSSSGYLVMGVNASTVDIRGDFINYSSSSSNSFTKGGMKLGGNVSVLYNGSYFRGSGTHKVVLNGAKEQKISFASTSSYFNELEVLNDKVTFITPVKFVTLASNGKIKSQGGTLYNINLNGHTLEVDGDVELAGGCDLAKGALKVNGNVKHTSGGITVKGTLIVNGDYILANTKINEEDEEVLTSSSGYLVMGVSTSLMEIMGDFINYSSSSSNSFTKGVLLLGGNVEDLYGGSNFVCSGEHYVILNGEKPQSITLKGSRNTFNTLQLTKDISNYTFDPNPCWKTLITNDIPVESLTIEPQKVKLCPGDSYFLELSVLPLNAAYLDVEWTSEDESIARVTDGQVTAVNPGTTRVYAEVGGKKAYCEITVKGETLYYVGGVEDLESIHPYAAASYEAWEYEIKDALSVTLTFSADTYVETDKDFIDIFIGDTLFGRYTGEELAGKSVTIPADHFKIVLRSNSTNNFYGFKVESMDCEHDLSLKSIAMEQKTLALGIGNEEQLRVVFNPDDTTEDTSLVWSSSDESVATVSGNGLVKAVGTGKTIITAASVLYPELSARCEIVVDTLYRYKVFFDMGMDETVLTPVVYEVDGLVSGESIGTQRMPVIPEKEGYAFIGWYTEPDGKGKEFTADTVITEDITVYAYWKEVVKEQRTGIWIEEVEEQIYTGKAVKPAVKVYYGNILLKEKTDYTVKYSNNTKAASADAEKAPTIKVSGKGNYKGSDTVTFAILPKDIAEDDEVTVAFTDTYAYKAGKAQKINPVIKYAFKTLKCGDKKDYVLNCVNSAGEEVDYKKIVDAGAYTLTITGVNNFTGSIEKEFIVTEKTVLDKLAFTKLKNVEYSGYEHTPAVIITDKTPNPDYVLKEGKDYSVEYDCNVEVGKAYVYIKALPESEYAGSKTLTFNITGINLKKAAVKEIPAKVTYTGSQITPVPELYLNYGKDNQEELVLGEHYEVRYGVNVDKGTGTVTLEGIGAYTGTVTKKFKIEARKLSADMLSEAVIKAEYVKGGAKPSNVELSYEGNVLVEGKDYTLSYKNNKAVTDEKTKKLPTIIIKGTGNYSGSIEKTFIIMKKDFSKTTIVAADVVSKEKSGIYTPKITVYDKDGQKLKAGTDYEKNVSYTYKTDTTVTDSKTKKQVYRSAGDEIQKNDIISAGTTLVATATPKGNYIGVEKSAEYRVVAYSINDTNYEKIVKDYTGEKITLTKEDIQLKLKSGSEADVADSQFEIIVDSYKNNEKKGKASVTIRGVGEFGGTKTITFTIQSKTIKFTWLDAVKKAFFSKTN